MNSELSIPAVNVRVKLQGNPTDRSLGQHLPARPAVQRARRAAGQPPLRQGDASVTGVPSPRRRREGS